MNKMQFLFNLCVFIVISLLSFYITAYSQTQSSDPKIDALLKAVQQAQHPVGNMQYKFTREISSQTGIIQAKSDVNSMAQYILIDYTVTISGIRTRVESYQKQYKSKLESVPYSTLHSVEVFDGTKVREIDESKNTVRGTQDLRKDNFASICRTLYGLPFDITSADMRNKYSYHLISSKENISILELTNTTVQAFYRAYIDSQKNNNIVAWEELRSDSIVLGKISYEYKQTKDGIWYPSGYHSVNYIKFTNKETVEQTDGYKIKNISAKFNIDISEDIFHLEFSPGTKVFDLVTNKWFTAGIENPLLTQ
jgi:hypothetical protein